MTGTQQYTCPLCDYTAGSKESVVYHISGKRDDAHKGKRGANFRAEIKPTTVDTGTDTGTESQDDTATKPVEFPTAPGGSNDSAEETSENQCCRDPQVEGAEGDHYALENGTIIRLEAGEHICLTCEAIHG